MNLKSDIEEELIDYEQASQSRCDARPSTIAQLEPFFENIILGVAFLVLGLNILEDWNASSLGFIGIVGIGFGGLKIVLGLFIYILNFYAILFKPEWKPYLKKRKEIKKTKAIIDDCIQDNRVDEAIARYRDLIDTYPNEIELRVDFASLCAGENLLEEAGMYLFFKSDKTEEEKDLVDVYIKSKENKAYELLSNATTGISLLCYTKTMLKQFTYYLEEFDLRQKEQREYYEYNQPVAEYLLNRKRSLKKEVLERKGSIIEVTIILLVWGIFYGFLIE